MATEAALGDQVLVEVPAPEPTLTAQIIGEIVGSFMIAVVGLGIGVASFVFGHQLGVTWFADIWPTAFGWSMAIALAIYCTASLSGAHFNPAVTLALAATGRHPWKRVPHYIGCQLVGWFLGAALVVGLFGRDIHAVADRLGIKYGAPGSWKVGSILTTYVPNPGVFGTGHSGIHLVPIGTGFLAEALGTAILLYVILSLLETRHANAPAAWFFPLIVGGIIGLLIMFVAGLTQASFNPARDLGPRFMLWIMGFKSQAFPGPRDGLALVVTCVGPIVGGLVGAFFHDLVVRPHIPGVEPEPAITQPGQMAREPTREVATSLLGHAPSMPLELLVGAEEGAEGSGRGMNSGDRC